MGKHYDADHQMSSSFTTQVYVDRDGFIWAATRNGLNRFDGYQYQVIKKEKGKDLGMASNYVNCMLQDRCGLFYVGMYGALHSPGIKVKLTLSRAFTPGNSIVQFFNSINGVASMVITFLN